ncbi:MAG: tyrosine-type recombinase/integrase [Pirellulaceae bacterium]
MPQKLTARFVETVKAQDRRQEYRDTEARGLILRVMPGGVKSWAILYSHHRRKRRLTLGEFPAIKLAKARELALDAIARVAQGQDPQGQKLAERRGRLDALSFNKLADAWIEKHARVKLKPTAVVEYERLIDADLRSSIGEMAADLITKQDVILKVRDKIAGRGARVHADRVVGMVSRIYSWAIDEEYVDSNPAYKIRKAAAGPSVRDRVLTAEEIGLFWNGLDKAEMSEPLRLIFRLALLTGQRRSEVAGIRKCEISEDDKLWILPGDRIENGQTIHGRTKNRRDHFVPLTDAAMEVVSKAIALSGESEFVFPSPVSEGRTGHINGEAVSMAMRRNREVAFGVPDMRTHDLRRTLRTFLGEQGIPDEVADRVLNHVRPGVGNQHYNHAKMLPQVRAALELWAEHVATACAEGERRAGENAAPTTTLRPMTQEEASAPAVTIRSAA